jgi:DNA-binding transcriptional LysR family regulator
MKSGVRRRGRPHSTDARAPLLDRSARGVSATAAGEIFARHARALLAMSEPLTGDVEAFVAGGAGSARLFATASSIGGSDLAQPLARFAAAHPRIAVDLREVTSAAALQALIESRADLAIIAANAMIPGDLVAATWRTDRLLLIVSASHQLARRRSVKLSEVLRRPMIEAMDHGALTPMLAEAAQKPGRAPHYRYRVATLDTPRRLAASGLAVNVIPDGLVLPYAAFGLKHLDIDEPWAARRLRLVSRSPNASRRRRGNGLAIPWGSELRRINAHCSPPDYLCRYPGNVNPAPIGAKFVVAGIGNLLLTDEGASVDATRVLTRCPSMARLH